MNADYGHHVLGCDPSALVLELHEAEVLAHLGVVIVPPKRDLAVNDTTDVHDREGHPAVTFDMGVESLAQNPLTRPAPDGGSRPRQSCA